jgi:hypothetical protein
LKDSGNLCTWLQSKFKAIQNKVQYAVNLPRVGISYITLNCIEDAQFDSQIRGQMSGPEISLYEKSILGCGLWSGLDCEIKGSGPIMSNI